MKVYTFVESFHQGVEFYDRLVKALSSGR